MAYFIDLDMRYILQESKEKPGYYICTDTKYNLVCTFKEGAFNQTQEVTDITELDLSAAELATAMRKMAEWLQAHHPDILFINYRTFIGQRIRSIRESKGLTQENLATLTGLNKQNISRIELGKYNNRIDILGIIAEALDCRIDFINK